MQISSLKDLHGHTGEFRIWELQGIEGRERTKVAPCKQLLSPSSECMEPAVILL